MLFNSLLFALFLTVTATLFFRLREWSHRKACLLVASYLFYAAWKPIFASLLVVSTVVDFLVARRMHASSAPLPRRLWLMVSLTLNLGLLFFFKYAGFVAENLSPLLGLAREEEGFFSRIVLPVGISFYTFQTLSYSIDVYRRALAPWPSFLDFALFVSFFPQLVAGPIVRASEFLPQLVRARAFDGARASWGASLLLIGLCGKIVFADTLLGPVADRVYGLADAPSFLDAWAGTLAFAGQIFFDFAGYSSCAIGTALILGFRLPDNFRFPYASRGPSEFWRRWHISLSTWLRDYLYIALGGNRRGRLGTLRNLMLTMLLGGLWHGAAWTFVVWGFLHGAYLVLERLLRSTIRLPHRIGSVLGWLLTFGAVNLAWVFFRARDLETGLRIARALLGLEGGPSVLEVRDRLAVAGLTGALLLTHWKLRDSSLEAAFSRLPWPLRALWLAGAAVLIVTCSGDEQSFLYFQF